MPRDSTWDEHNIFIFSGTAADHVHPRIGADDDVGLNVTLAAMLPPLLGGTSIETAGAAESVVHFARAALGQEQPHVDYLH